MRMERNACHDSVCRTLRHALTLGDDGRAWDGLATVFQARLTPLERSLLLASVLASLDLDDALDVVGLCVERQRVGLPVPVLEDIAAEARWWADLALPEELRAWLAACFVRLPRRDQAAFLSEAGGRHAA